MSSSDASSSTLVSCNTNVTHSSSSDDDLIVPNLEAFGPDGDQEVTQPLVNNDQNAEGTHQAPNQPAANEQNVIPPDPRRHIGVNICKECDGTKYLGKVVGYNDRRRWFRVEYSEEEFEDMDEESVLRLRAKQSDIIAAQAQASGSGSTRMNHAGGPGKKAASRKRSRKDKNSYVPLALRETKKDAYYFY